MTVKPRTNFYLDVFLFLLMVIVLISGLVLWVGSGEGQHQGRGWQNAGDNDVEHTLLLNRQDWKTLHIWLGLAVGGIIMVHLVFHWKWIGCRLRTDMLGQKPDRPVRHPVCSE
jgi:cytochrome b561